MIKIRSLLVNVASRSVKGGSQVKKVAHNFFSNDCSVLQTSDSQVIVSAVFP